MDAQRLVHGFRNDHSIIDSVPRPELDQCTLMTIYVYIRLSYNRQWHQDVAMGSSNKTNQVVIRFRLDFVTITPTYLGRRNLLACSNCTSI